MKSTGASVSPPSRQRRPRLFNVTQGPLPKPPNLTVHDGAKQTGSIPLPVTSSRDVKISHPLPTASSDEQLEDMLGETYLNELDGYHRDYHLQCIASYQQTIVRAQREGSWTQDYEDAILTACKTSQLLNSQHACSDIHGALAFSTLLSANPLRALITLGRDFERYNTSKYLVSIIALQTNLDKDFVITTIQMPSFSWDSSTSYASTVDHYKDEAYHLFDSYHHAIGLVLPHGPAPNYD